MRRYFKRAIAVLAIALMCSTLIGGGVLAENESENDFNDGVNVEETGGNEDVPEIYSEGKPGAVSGETEGEELETNVEEARSALAGVVSPQSDDCPVELNSSIESSSTYHNVKQEVSDFTLSTTVNGNKQYTDNDRVFTYNFNLIKNGKGLTTSLPYKLMSGGTVVSEHTLELENGNGSVSFPARYQFKTESMPTGVNYQITHKADENYTWDKEFVNDTTDLSGSNESFTATYKYSPVKYSLDTNIIVNMDGRAFKAGDSFTYSIAPEKKGDPIFNMFPLPSGDSDTIAYYENSARIKPSSGTTANLSLAEDIQRCSSIYCSGCKTYYKTPKEYNYYCENKGCFGSYTVVPSNINVAPEICFLYPGTYNYIVFQTAMESSDYDSIKQDSAQYKVTVKVDANGSNLTPSLTSVKKSTDGGKTWIDHPDKSKLTFTNVKIDGVVKGDIDKDGKVNMTDVIACLNHVAKKKILTGEALAAADVDGNGVSMTDVIKILNFVSKKTSTL